MLKVLVVCACRELQEMIAMFNYAMSKRFGAKRMCLGGLSSKKVTMSGLIQLS